MEKFILDRDMQIMYVTASSFPEGIMTAFEEIRKKVTAIDQRPVFGISKPENGGIVYRAGVLQTEDGEAEKYGVDLFTMPAGVYMTETIHDRMKNTPAIGAAFQQLIALPKLDPNAYCIEWYKGNDVMCMVKIVE